MLKQKICYVLPAYDPESATHFSYLPEFIREISKTVDVFLVIERGELPRDGFGVRRMLLADSRLSFLRLIKTKVALWKARAWGCRTFYVHYSFFPAFFASLITRFFGGRTIYWNCGEPWKYKRPWLRERFERFTYRLIHVLVTGTAGLADQYAAHYRISREKVHVMPNWVSPQEVKGKSEKVKVDELRTKLHIAPNQKVLLFVHRLSRRKGAHLLPEILNKLHDENVVLLIVGEGPERERIQLPITNYQLQNKVRFLGAVPNYQLPNYYSLADVLLMPSEEEGFPHVLLEAMAAGVPFVATAVGGVRDMVPSVAQEFVVREGAIPECARAVRILLNLESKRHAVQSVFPEWIKQYELSCVSKTFADIVFDPAKAKRARLYYVANARMPNPKAHGIQLAKMCEAFVKNGVDLTLILPRKQAEFPGELGDFYGLRHRVKAVRVPVFDIRRGTRFGFNLGATSFAVAAWCYLVFQKLCGKGGAVYTIDLDQFSFFTIPFAGMPYAFETHSSKRGNFAYRFFFRRAQGIIPVNQGIATALKKTFGVREGRIRVLPNGVDLEQFGIRASKHDARKKLGLPIEGLIVLYVGRFYSWKSLETFAGAAERLADTVHWYLVGGTREEFRVATGLTSFPANLHFTGSRPHAEIPLWIRAADCCLVLGTERHEYSFHETSPMKLFEYMAGGRPIVASKTRAIEEIVSVSEAFLAKPDDPDALASAVREVLANQSEAEARTLRAREKAEHLSWDARARIILNLMHLL